MKAPEPKDRDEYLYRILACPACRKPLRKEAETLVCSSLNCSIQPNRWPIVDGIPVIFDERRSLFRVEEAAHGPHEGSGTARNCLSRILNFRPGLSRNTIAARNYEKLSDILKERGEAKILAVGCGEGGAGLSRLSIPGCRYVFADVKRTPIVSILCDGQQLPFRDGEFDALVLQAVLEHIIDYEKVIDEATRVLKGDGLVYCEFPFMQPVHGGAYDFARLSQVGLRYAFRHYDEIKSGICGGPGAAAALSLQAVFRCIVPGRIWVRVADVLADWMFWWFKYLDPWLIRSPAAVDAASGFYFLGQRRSDRISNRMVIDSYRGAVLPWKWKNY